MDLMQVEDKAKLIKDKTKEAIALALEGQWERAVSVNREILRMAPEDVEALNRLGKALMELGRYSEAREAFQRATEVSPHNAIAKKNLERLAHLAAASPTATQSKKVTPYHFIKESGRSGVATLYDLAPKEVLAKVAAGDPVTLKVDGHSLVVQTPQGEYLGKVTPKLALRLLKLIQGGNRYEGAMARVRDEEVSVLLWEAYRHPSLSGVSSFPAQDKEEYPGYLRDTLLRYGMESDTEASVEDEADLEWKDEETLRDVDEEVSSTVPLDEIEAEEETEEEEET